MAGQFLETIGIEIEGVGNSRDDLMRALIKSYGEDILRYIQVERDASIESHFRMLSAQGLGVFDHNPVARGVSNGVNRITLGYELKTSPVTFEMMEELIPKIMSVIISKGEISSPRAALHVHIGYAHNFKLLMNALRIGLWIEPLMYRLGGMGGMFRGEINNSIYCRPLSLGVAVKGDDRNIYRLPTIDKLLATSNSEDFWSCYGLYMESFMANPNRYTPGRYFGLNLMSTIIHGTLEFRYFNQSLNSAWILTIARLCQAITELTSVAPKDWVKSLPIPSMLDSYSTDYCNRALHELESIFDKFDITYTLTDTHKSILRKIISASESPSFNKELPVSHIRGWYLNGDQIKTGLYNRITNFCESGFVDVHNIDELDMSSI